MHAALLPLFPLEVVLLPHAPLPLHIFEDRYKEMFQDILREDSEFGVVLTRHQGILRTGCSATVTEVLQRYDDGRLDVMTIGQRRFQIREVNTERSFLRGAVEYFDDPVSRPAGVQQVRDAAARYLELAREMEQEVDPPDLDDPELSFQLGQLTTDLDFRQTLLDMLSESQRIDALVRHFDEQILKQRVSAHLKRASRQNGHGTHLPID